MPLMFLSLGVFFVYASPLDVEEIWYQDNIDGGQKWRFCGLVTENFCSKVSFVRCVADGRDPAGGKWKWISNATSCLAIRCFKGGVDTFKNGSLVFKVTFVDTFIVFFFFSFISMVFCVVKALTS